jgi:LDH2 family malate/lactate/ureidoglycolate dehydrogenase
LPSEVAGDVTDIMLESDVLGHRTHGFAFLPVYLDRLAAGTIATSGDIEVLADGGASFAWNAHRLAGAWVTRRAIRDVVARAKDHAVVTATIANCSHIGCLQAYLRAMTDEGLFATLSATNPGISSVAPFGGADPVLTTNPIAYGIPTNGDPILIDQCTSVVSNAAVQERERRGEPVPASWLLDGDGEPTADATLLSANPPATIMPLGGPEFGYKGFGFGLMVEALTLALSGFGRTSSPDRVGQSVFLQVIDPRGFAGRDFFNAEMSQLAKRCRDSRPKQGGGRVRLPGERALAERDSKLREGLTFPADVIGRIEEWGRRLSIGDLALAHSD